MNQPRDCQPRQPSLEQPHPCSKHFPLPLLSGGTLRVNPVAVHLIARFKGEEMTPLSPGWLAAGGSLCPADETLPSPRRCR